VPNTLTVSRLENRFLVTAQSVHRFAQNMRKEKLKQASLNAMATPNSQKYNPDFSDFNEIYFSTDRKCVWNGFRHFSNTLLLDQTHFPLLTMFLFSTGQKQEDLFINWTDTRSLLLLSPHLICTPNFVVQFKRLLLISDE
jgi:hypothetical protein